jgi:phosphoglycerate-specific signal transduction histidine kinase
MNSATDTAATGSPTPIEEAAARSAQIQQDLLVAEAELQLTNTVLGRAKAPDHHEDDVKKAVAQNVAIEEKVGEAAQDLQEVTELLQAEVCERERLEQELEQSRSSS